MHVQMRLQLHRQPAVQLRVFGLRVSGLQHSGHLRDGLLQMQLGAGMIPSGARRNPFVGLVGLGRTPRTDGSAYSVHVCTSRITTLRQLAVLRVL
jgi:hypothetical protein